MNIKHLDNQELQAVLKNITKGLREATADGLALLVEVGRRELHVAEGYASLFTYCLGELCFTKGMASRWSRAAKAASIHPDILERLRDGRLSLCVVTVLADRPELIAKADHMTKEEAERLLATERPRPERKDVVPAMVFSIDSDMTFSRREHAAPMVASTAAAAAVSMSPVSTSAEIPRKKHVIEPIAATRSRLHCDVDAETLAKLHRAREIMRGKELNSILSVALDLLLDARDPIRRHERREQTKAARAATKKERKPRRQHLKREVKDAAQAAAGGQCEFIGKSGKRCTEREWSEHDHTQPLALGGNNDLSNIRILCRRHHRHVTSQSFGGWSPFLAAQ